MGLNKPNWHNCNRSFQHGLQFGTWLRRACFTPSRGSLVLMPSTGQANACMGQHMLLAVPISEYVEKPRKSGRVNSLASSRNEGKHAAAGNPAILRPGPVPPLGLMDVPVQGFPMLGSDPEGVGLQPVPSTVETSAPRHAQYEIDLAKRRERSNVERLRQKQPS